MAAGLVLLVLALPARAGAEGADEGAPDPLVIGSKNFTENRLLGEMLAQLVEAHTDVPVERRTNLGGTKVVFTALESGEIDLYPEYTGTAWTVMLRGGERLTNPLETYARVTAAFRRRYELVWLSPFGFDNTYAMAMPEDVAERLGVRRISELEGLLEELRIGVSHECLSREDGFLSLAEHYGFEVPKIRGIDHGLAYEGLRTGRIDLVDTWATDGKLLRYDVRVLEDDENFFPPYDCAPVVRTDALARHPGLDRVLDMLAFRLPDVRMRELNAAVEDGGGDFEAVAREFLVEEGLVGADGAARSPRSTRPGLLRVMWRRRGETLELTVEHLALTGLAVLLAILLAVPLGLLLTRREALAPIFLGLAGVIQTVPSLAMLAFMIPVLGLGVRSAVAALFLYALLPIVRNTYTGIRAVDPELVEAARGMGLRDHQVLGRLELPLATRTIMAGIRTSTVISVGVATLAAFIGAGGLGDPIVTGLQLNDNQLILSGAIPAALLAILVDAMLGRLEDWLAPPGVDAAATVE